MHRYEYLAHTVFCAPPGVVEMLLLREASEFPMPRRLKFHSLEVWLGRSVELMARGRIGR